MKKLVFILCLVNFSLSLHAQPATSSEKQSITYRREEEKKARDLYRSFSEKWASQAFENVSRAELVHMSRVKELIDKYDLADPIAETKDRRGIFLDASIQKEYDSLLKAGMTSRVAAFRAAAYVEEKDIHDLKILIRHAKDDFIKYTYEYLLQASENHLRAFERNLRRAGEGYSPVVLSADEYEEIIFSRGRRK